MNGKVPPVLQRLLERELSPDERILWSATPSIRKWPGSYLIVFLTVVVIVLECQIWRLTSRVFGLTQAMGLSGAPLIQSLIIILTVLTILLPLSFWWTSRRTLFVVSDRRAMVIRNIFGCRIKSFTGEQLIRVERTENSHGNGSIRFGYDLAFWGIADTRHVAMILRGVFENGAKMTASGGNEIEVDMRQSRRWPFLMLGIAGGLINLIFAFSLIPRFAAIFQDMLPDSKLPWAAQAVLGGKWVFVAIALLWPIAALLVMKFSRMEGRRLWLRLAFFACAVLIQFLIPSGILFSILLRFIRHLGGQG